jgi:hypothetical protein
MLERLQEWLKSAREMNNVLDLRWRPAGFLLSCAGCFGSIFSACFFITIAMVLNASIGMAYFVANIAMTSLMLAVVLGLAAFLIPVCFSLARFARHLSDPTLEAE